MQRCFTQTASYCVESRNSWDRKNTFYQALSYTLCYFWKIFGVKSELVFQRWLNLDALLPLWCLCLLKQKHEACIHCEGVFTLKPSRWEHEKVFFTEVQQKPCGQVHPEDSFCCIRRFWAASTDLFTPDLMDLQPVLSDAFCAQMHQKCVRVEEGCFFKRKNKKKKKSARNFGLY